MLQADREAELKRELEEAREREAQLEKVKAETQARLDTLKEEYDESQHNLGNARLAWKALVRNLKFEEEKNREMEAEMKTLKVSARTAACPCDRLFSAVCCRRHVSAAAPSAPSGGF